MYVHQRSPWVRIRCNVALRFINSILLIAILSHHDSSLRASPNVSKTVLISENRLDHANEHLFEHDLNMDVAQTCSKLPVH